jgi:glycosyltransferase involved in cell wall biosynthesis
MGNDASHPSDCRVLVVIDTLGQGGAEHSIAAVAPLLVAHGVRISILCLRRDTSHVADGLVEAGIPVSYASDPTPKGLVRELWKRLRADPPDVLHVSLFVPTMAAAVASYRTGVPVLATLANTPAIEEPRTSPGVAPWKLKVVHAMEAWAFRHRMAHLHAVTAGVAETCGASYGFPPGAVTVVERGRDPQLFRPPTAAERAEARAELGASDAEQVVLAVGRLEPQKATADLVRAAGILQQGGYGPLVLIAGRDGGASAAVKAAIAGLSHPDRVRLLGNRPDVARLLWAADLFVLASLREGAAGAALEAMASGLPMVATDVAGLRGVVADGEQCRVVPTGDPAAMAAGIAELLADPALRSRLGQAARQRFTERFTVDRAAEGMAALYRSVASAGSARAHQRRPRGGM